MSPDQVPRPASVKEVAGDVVAPAVPDNLKSAPLSPIMPFAPSIPASGAMINAIAEPSLPQAPILAELAEVAAEEKKNAAASAASSDQVPEPGKKRLGFAEQLKKCRYKKHVNN